MSLDKIEKARNPIFPTDAAEREIHQNFGDGAYITKQLIPYILQLHESRFSQLETAVPQLRQESAYFYIKGNCLSEKHPREAINAYQHSLTLYPDNILVHHKLARIYRNCFIVERAEYHVNKALALSDAGKGSLGMKDALKKLQTDIQQEALVLSMLNVEKLEGHAGLTLSE